jgi:hypothetical protein
MRTWAFYFFAPNLARRRVWGRGQGQEGPFVFFQFKQHCKRERKRVRGEDKTIWTIVNSSNLNSITRWRGGGGRMRRIIGP